MEKVLVSRESQRVQRDINEAYLKTCQAILAYDDALFRDAPQSEQDALYAAMLTCAGRTRIFDPAEAQQQWIDAGGEVAVEGDW